MYLTGVKSDRGMATLIALIMVGMLTLLGLAAMTTSDDEVSIAGNERQETRAFYAAEAGLERAAAGLQTEYEATGLPPTTMPSGNDSINGAVVAYNTVDDGPATQRTLTNGSLAGLRALVKSFTINAIGISPVDHGKVALSQSFETDLIPVYQFAVFYGQDLEIAPGPDMTLVGRVHSNQDMYLQSGANLNMDSYVTAAGSLYHGRKGPGSADAGDVKIKNASGTYVSMKQGSGWMDAHQANWYDSSVARWNGRVQDESHGQKALNLPLTNSSDPHKVIEPASGGNSDSYENQATLKIIDNKAYQKVAGAWVDVTAAMTAAGVITYTADKFTDQRENKKVDVTDLDVAKLYTSGYAPSNGIVYFSDNIASSSEFPGLRLKNGSTLNAGLTIASANPIYTVGNYNSVNKKPASLLADAITYLSGSWDDSKSTLAKSNRVATATTVNASYMTGNVATTSTVYSGGFENLPRFLETWSGKDFTWRGSAVCLWASRQSTGSWTGTYYDPPTRKWYYDIDLDDPSKLPPGTPTVRVFDRTGWQEQYVGAQR
jgi:hypothetical protein